MSASSYADYLQKLPAAERELTELTAWESRRCLRTFLKCSWPILEPGRPLIWGWHLDAICEHLQAVSRRQLSNLIITQPPGTAKSTNTSVVWPVHHWVEQPEARFISCSYNFRLAVRDTRKSRRIIDSPWFQHFHGRRFQLTSDQNEKSRYENDRTGYRIAFSKKGGSTGERADFSIIDDPHNVRKVESEADREATIDWHDHEWYNRLNDEKLGGRVVVGQRVRHNDLIGHLLASGDWFELRIPEEYEKGNPTRFFLPVRLSEVAGEPVVKQDPRRNDGQLLRPERFGRKEAEREKKKGRYYWSSQYQQRPIPREGGMFQRHWFKRFIRPAALPKGLAFCRYWDKAATEGGGKRTAGVLMAEPEGGGTWYVVNCRKGQWSPMNRNTILKQVAQADYQRYGRGLGDIVQVVEEEGGSGGKESADITLKDLAGYRVKAHRKRVNKAVAAEPFADQCEAGNVVIVRADGAEGAWVDEFLDELCMFDGGAKSNTFCDQVDAASGAFNYLRTRPASRIRKQPSSAAAASLYRTMPAQM